jgi:hypothetical protein
MPSDADDSGNIVHPSDGGSSKVRHSTPFPLTTPSGHDVVERDGSDRARIRSFPRLFFPCSGPLRPDGPSMAGPGAGHTRELLRAQGEPGWCRRIATGVAARARRHGERDGHGRADRRLRGQQDRERRPVEAGPRRPSLNAVAYDNTASAANFGFTSTDLAAAWGDELLTVNTGCSRPWCSRSTTRRQARARCSPRMSA